jgi:glyoxylase-like metal-dependent hydrolase (beta-lactamase superfamily II)
VTRGAASDRERVILGRVMLIEVAESDIVGLRANNPGPFTLSGTNSWVIGRDPAWVVDPGPLLEAHLEALRAELHRRGGLGGIALTHDHPDHAEAAVALAAGFPGTAVAAARGNTSLPLIDGQRFGPLLALAAPGHAPDHYAFLVADVLLTGDAVLGEGSVFIAPDPGALKGYLEALERLRRMRPRVICPGHGPVVLDADAKLAGYIAHRLDRERRLLDALQAGARTTDELLDRAWSDVPSLLRPAAAVTLAAHLDKLDADGLLPTGVERPEAPAWLRSQA